MYIIVEEAAKCFADVMSEKGFLNINGTMHNHREKNTQDSLKKTLQNPFALDLY